MGKEETTQQAHSPELGSFTELATRKTVGEVSGVLQRREVEGREGEADSSLEVKTGKQVARRPRAASPQWLDTPLIPKK